MDLTNLNKDRKTRRTNKNELNTLMYGMVPPQSIMAEEDLLGKILQFGNEPMDRVTDFLENPKAFYVEAHQRIFQAMLNLRARSVIPDIVSVVEELRRTEELDLVGGPYYITKLTNSVMVATNIEHMAKLIVDRFTARELIRIGGEMVGAAYEDNTDPYDLLDEMEKQLYSLSFKNNQTGYVSVNNSSIKAIQHLEHLRSLNIEIHGVPSGFISLDKITGGWQDTDLIVLAARPGVGKTAFALNLASNSAKSGKPVLFFSLEMSTMQCTQRLASAESEILLDKILKPFKLEQEEVETLYQKGFKEVAKLPIYIDDTPAMSIYQIRAKARAFFKKKERAKENAKGLIIVDYLQLMSGIQNGRADNREQEISKITRDLKGLAKELNLPIIALSQLSREVEKRTTGKKIPQLSDLRESGAIEQDADMVMFIYRPEYYEIHVNDKGGNNNGETHIKIAKHRNGTLETIKLKAKLHIQKFQDFETKESQLSIEPDPFPLDEKPATDDLARLFIGKGSKMNAAEHDEEDWNFNN